MINERNMFLGILYPSRRDVAPVVSGSSRIEIYLGNLYFNLDSMVQLGNRVFQSTSIQHYSRYKKHKRSYSLVPLCFTIFFARTVQ